jgi:GntR family transcriptional regulator, transcriptional repressor for pyruvate dehydrogenase complex
MKAGAAEQHHLPRLSEIIAGELRRRILSGEFADGDTLPKQEDLFEQFGVSPPSVREALRVLETEGLVTVKRGNVGGAVVHAPVASKVAYMLGMVLQSRSVPIRDVSDALAHLDPACAAQCALRRDRKRTVVRILRATVKESGRLLDDPPAYAAVARRFHQEMVDNCGNETMRIVVGTLETLWTQHVRWLSGRPGPPGRPPESAREEFQTLSVLAARQDSLDEHAALVELISAGDSAGATLQAHRHLSEHQDLAYPFSLDTVVSADILRDGSSQRGAVG